MVASGLVFASVKSRFCIIRVEEDVHSEKPFPLLWPHGQWPWRDWWAAYFPLALHEWTLTSQKGRNHRTSASNERRILASPFIIKTPLLSSYGRSAPPLFVQKKSFAQGRIYVEVESRYPAHYLHDYTCRGYSVFQNRTKYHGSGNRAIAAERAAHDKVAVTYVLISSGSEPQCIVVAAVVVVVVVSRGVEFD